MEKRLSYIIVGAFVLVLSLSLFAFLFWLAKYGNKSVEYDYYKTYFNESVSGLNIESFVKLKGVEVGRVRKISINKNNSEEVEVLLEIQKNTPVKEDTYAMLDSQGITGLKYIELKGGSKSAKLLKTSKENIAVIPSRKSVLSTLLEGGEVITEKVNRFLDKLDILFSRKNIDNLSKITENLTNTTGYIEKNKEKFFEIIAKLDEMKISIDKALNSITKDVSKFTDNSIVFLQDTKEFENKLLPAFEKLGKMSDRAGAASDATKKLFDDLSKKADSGEFDVAEIVENNLQILNEAAFALRDLSIKLNETVEELKRSPSDILYKSRKRILGPGEKDEK